MMYTARLFNLLEQLIERSSRSRFARKKGARHLFFRLARHYTATLVSNVGSATFYVDTADPIIGREVFVEGDFQRPVMTRIFDVLAAFGYTDFTNKTFVDIGANIGTSCIPALMDYHFSRVIAFEPAPRNLELLRLNIAANHLEDVVQVFGTALSSTETQMSLELSPVNPGDHRVRIDTSQTQTALELHSESQWQVTTVAVNTFDHFVQTGDIVIKELGLVWIDAQGHEGHILAGAQSLLQSSVPVLMEYWPYGLERAGTLEQIQDLLAAHYTYFVDIQSNMPIGPEMLTPISGLAALRHEYNEHHPENPHTDILLVKQS